MLCLPAKSIDDSKKPSDFLIKLLLHAATILYCILVFFIVFDGLRDALVLSNFLSWVRELVVFGLFLLSFVVGFKHKQYFWFFYFPMALLLLSFSYSLIYSISPVYPDLDSISEPLVVWYRSIQFVMLFFVFVHIEQLTGRKIEFFLTLFVYLSVAYALMTPVLYFFPISYMVDDYKMWGRLGVGYPTMDAQTFCYSILAVIFIFKHRNIKLNMFLVVLLAGLAMQVTGTGIATILVVIFAFVFFKRNDKAKVFELLPMVVLSVLLMAFILSLFAEDLSQIIWLFWDKIENLKNLGVGQSTEIRAAQFEFLWGLLRNSPLEMLFGIGCNIYVENQYSFVLISCGVFGLFLFLFFILWMICTSFLWKKYDGGCLLVSVAIFCMTSYTLVSLYLFPCSACFALFYTYSMIKYKRSMNTHLSVL